VDQGEQVHHDAGQHERASYHQESHESQRVDYPQCGELDQQSGADQEEKEALQASRDEEAPQASRDEEARQASRDEEARQASRDEEASQEENCDEEKEADHNLTQVAENSINFEANSEDEGENEEDEENK